jgi:hypothetical protein
MQPATISLFDFGLATAGASTLTFCNEMKTSIGTFQGLNAGGYGRVHVSRSDADSPLSVEVILDDHEWNDQLRDGGFSDWQDASIYGVRYALEQAGIRQGRWTVCRIIGLLVDTTPTIVAVAAARAAWSFAGFSPPQDLDDRLQQLALASEPNVPPSFDP